MISYCSALALLITCGSPVLISSFSHPSLKVVSRGGLATSTALKSKSVSSIKTLPNDDESWFVKTEQFCRPFPEVRPHLEAHRKWVDDLRKSGKCMTSGYRVDSEGKPGGGGLMIFAAKDYAEAEELVRQDPLVANGCVDW
eukprot:CAMPEP_0183307264 /NCGR_PEP_ID=MMETSP0160_2-20130417/17230_1 /TAXON_ID=2839 ORGANISM="Odontella Sinensis, Strain Grunow 1884" /NCGR_SAMPLE_ID=MMETSP0160_2 /ASSEMBLY_ACC=CAM_ASM_000250 /LENGTH=140 /DNA_ID=CAMNT_0025470817 /DNA_START=69 /DNA_END=488 /DNA_ORIENTATION=-